MARFLIIILSVSLGGCYSLVLVNRQLPPEIRLPSDKAEILFVSRYDTNRLEFDNENKVEVFAIGARNLVLGLKWGYDADDHFHLFLSDTLLSGMASLGPVSDLQPELVRTLCKLYDREYLQTLDAYTLYFDQDMEVTENQDGSKDRRAYYDLVVVSYFTIYNQNGVAIAHSMEKGREFYDDRSVYSGLLAAGPSMGKADLWAARISREVGMNFMRNFYSQSIAVDRIFFDTQEFQTAYEAFLAKDWNLAEEELLRHSENPDPKISGRSAYNLAVLYENLGRLDEMDYWYAKSKQLLGSKTPDLTMPEDGL